MTRRRQYQLHMANATVGNVAALVSESQPETRTQIAPNSRDVGHRRIMVLSCGFSYAAIPGIPDKYMPVITNALQKGTRAFAHHVVRGPCDAESCRATCVKRQPSPTIHRAGLSQCEWLASCVDVLEHRGCPHAAANAHGHDTISYVLTTHFVQ